MCKNLLDPPVQPVRRELLRQSPVGKVLKAIKGIRGHKVLKGIPVHKALPVLRDPSENKARKV